MKRKFKTINISKPPIGQLHLIFLMLLISSCSKPEAKQTESKHKSYKQLLKYDLRNPDKEFPLPSKVAEISGLTKYGENKLLFLNDEDGKVFQFDLKKKEIQENFRFWKKGDFEGIELLGDRVYTLQSDGDLISFEIKDGDVGKTRKEETPLGLKNDTEGLGYDPEQNVLLIACKAKGDIGDQKVAGKVVYAYDYEKRIFNKKPVIQVRWEQVRDFLKDNGLDIFINDSRRFKPSAIAVHPITKNYFVLSTTGKSLIVFDRKGEIVLYYTVPRKILEQPEGICFDPNGDMYLSSEGDEEKPLIVKFNMKKL